MTPQFVSFTAFLVRLSNGRGTRSDWERFCVLHYADERLEHARRELVRVAISCERWSWDDPVPDIVRTFAIELLNQLSHKESILTREI